MTQTARDFRNCILKPNLEEYSREYDKMHRAYNAVNAVDAYAAHIFHEAKKAKGNPFHKLGLTPSDGNDDVAFRQALAKKDSDFRVLRDLAKANKHAQLIRHKPMVTDSGQTSAQSKGWGEGRWGEARYGGVMQIFVTDEDGREHYVETLVKRSVQALDEVARQLGLDIFDE